MIFHYTRNDEGRYDVTRYVDEPMPFVVTKVPDGVPVRIYYGSIAVENDVTEDFNALQKDGDYHVVESPGGGNVLNSAAFKIFVDPLGITKQILKLITPQVPGSSNLSNSQGQSPNNSLTDRNNKPRPYERSYDICGTVQTIPNDLMTSYKLFDDTGRIIEYGYYDAGRGDLNTPASGITDGDTLVSEISGASAAVYGPFKSPNNSTPYLLIGDPVGQGLFITVSSNEVDGATLKAPNELASNVGSISFAESNGRITDPTGDADFSAYISAGEYAVLTNIIAPQTGSMPSDANLSGTYRVLSVSGVDILLDTAGSAEWAKLPAGGIKIREADNATVGPQDVVAKSLTPWVTLRRIKSERIVVNIGAEQGLYRDNGNRKERTSVTAEVQYQLIGDDDQPYGPIYSTQQTIASRSADANGMSIVTRLPTSSFVRVRCRRVTDKDFSYQGQVIDEIKYNNLYGQIQDLTPHYGDRTTVHTARKQTARATSIRSPQLKMIATEMVYKYLGAGVFDNVKTPNTKAVQSLIRLMRDPVVGGIDMTTDNMDRLLAVQDEIEAYFGSELAGQFCYTFDSYDTTAQDIIGTIADAVFCRSYREGNAILLDFDRPRPGAEMVFTHRSKSPEGEKWTRSFNDRNTFDSLKFTYIDPTTNIKETITIPPEGGAKTETFDSKGIRNRQQAFWAANRRHQRNLNNKIAVEFSATEEGVFARPGRVISVVKGARVAPFDGYVIAVDGLKLTLSQPVSFTPGDDHSVMLKRRDGSVQSVDVTPGDSSREVVMSSAPQEQIYTGNSALKTEFSFGSEQRHNAQMIVVSTVSPGTNRTVKISGYNYSVDYYKFDGAHHLGRAFSDGFDNGFS